MQDLPTDTKQRMPSSQVLEEVIHQAPAEYVTVGWLTSTLHQHSFGIIMLSLGPKAANQGLCGPPSGTAAAAQELSG
jgi:hypothetical protein